MPEFRRDMTTGQWVIVANKRARRPHDVAHDHRVASMTGNATTTPCPFCPGHEEETPPPVHVVVPGEFAAGEAGTSHRGSFTAASPWLLRVVPNRFPALEPKQAFVPAGDLAFFERTGAAGFHEVVIETPVHNTDLWRLPPTQIERVVEAYAERERVLRASPGIAFVIIFRNHGRDAGSSLAHPHSQIMATPQIPPEAARRLEVAQNYMKRRGRPLYRDMLERELAVGERVIESMDGMTVLAPFASRLPFETWILPHEQTPAFSQAHGQTLAMLARTLRRTLARLANALDNPAYNMVVYSAPVGAEHDTAFAWHLQIVPRVTLPAGFELGAGMAINTVRPEDSATFLASASPD